MRDFDENGKLSPFYSSDKNNIWSLDIASGKIVEDFEFMSKWGLDCKYGLAYWFANAAGYVQPGREKLVAKAIMHFFRVVKLNAFCVTEVKEDERHFEASRPLPEEGKLPIVLTGLALYAGPSLFNHACLRNATPFFIDGGGIAIVATDTIRPGKEICINYPGCGVGNDEARYVLTLIEGSKWKQVHSVCQY